MKKLFILGIGPGDSETMTFASRSALEQSQIITGYARYVELVRPLFPEKTFYSSSMMQEVDRCRKALDLASEGKIVALICSGDPGVYGMAGLALELSDAYPDVEIEILPGVTAALSGAALLGAPLIHDFAVISLSDLLTPWELIEKRLMLAAMGDFCIALYNPSSKKRKDYLEKACSILLQHKSPNTLCGLVRNVGRDGQSWKILTLSNLSKTEADMFTTVFIGNAQTKMVGGRMVTPRGYRIE